MMPTRLAGLAHGHVLACAALFVSLTACGDDVQPAASADAGTADATDDGLSNPANLPSIAMPQATQAARSPTAEQRSAIADKFRSKQPFDDLQLMPGVIVATQAQADAVYLAADHLRFPLAGNEDLLALKAGDRLMGGRAINANRYKTLSNNIFGFMRIVKTAEKQADRIIITTDRGKLSSFVRGAARLVADATKVAPLDITGVNMKDFLPTFHGEYEPFPDALVADDALEIHRMPLRLDARVANDGGQDYAHVQGSTEFGASFDVNIPFDLKTQVGGVELALKGNARLGPYFEMIPSMFLDIMISGDSVLEPDLDYFALGAAAKLTIGTELALDLEVTAAGGVDKSSADAAKSELKSKPGNKRKEFELADLGPFPIAGIFTVDVEVVLSCGFELYGELHATADAGFQTEVDFGVRYEDKDPCLSDKECFHATCGADNRCKGGWSTFFSGSFDKYATSSLTAGGGITATCGIAPRIVIMLADTVGPYVGLGGNVRGTASYASTCPATEQYLPKSQAPDGQATLAVDVGFDVHVGGEFEPLDFGPVDVVGFIGGLFGVDLSLSIGPYVIYEKWWNLWSKTWDFPGGGLGWCGSLCESGKTDGMEPDKDCGGVCGGCKIGQKCKQGSDCASGNCASGKCGEALCSNGKLDTGESDVDCGHECPDKCALGKKCGANDDCAGSAFCDTLAGVCAKPACDDGVHNGPETDVDCGGTCPGCGDGKTCAKDGDCKAGGCAEASIAGEGLVRFCTESVTCVANGFDGKKSGVETGVDCGGACANAGFPDFLCTPSGCGDEAFGCPKGAGCAAHTDCSSGYCDPAANTCGSPTCESGKLDGSETDVDCGGTCSACGDGMLCKVAADCAAGLVCNGCPGCPVALKVDTRCRLATCFDGKQGGGELGVDCGGPCPQLCDLGEGCKADAGCKSGQCGIKGTCVATACDNGRFDPAATETDVDCGGFKCNGKQCANGKGCLRHTDCIAAFCHPQDALCRKPTCDDGYRNGKESDVDCGMACPARCKIGQACGQSADCDSKACLFGKCVVHPCENGLFDGFLSNAFPGETDTDCGGMCRQKSKCGDGKKCRRADDCESAMCGLANRCVKGPCFDDVLGADETDTDCGGACVKEGNTCAAGRICKADSDCATGSCVKGRCAWNLCGNGVQNGLETDVDCGGTCPTGCAVGKACKQRWDCMSGACDGKLCVASVCDDKTLSLGESDVDCGGVCAKDQRCAVGKACLGSGDCASNVCSVGGKCVATACEDELLSVGETDTDCGGKCGGKCGLSKGCAAGKDCVSGICNGSVCVASTCADRQKSAGESDVDCGGTCATKCSTGKLCSLAKDCASGVCSKAGRCVLSACDDGVLDGQESDLDCGGTCATKCYVGQACKVGGDCLSGKCTAGKCVSTACVNTKKDGDETDVDCGGSCPGKCAEGKVCQQGGDCASTVCVAGKCAAGLCEDNKLSGDETDVDCGGSCSLKCGVAKGCKIGADCSGGVCGVAGTNKGKCVATACEDGVQSSAESDVDCGGSCKATCADGLACKVDGDCDNKVCGKAGANKGTCVATVCIDGVQSGDESDADCGGSCAAKCAQGDKCGAGSDCLSTVCAVKSKLCVKDACSDQQKGGGESDVDCGGPCSKCALGQACGGRSDCESGLCDKGQCAKPAVCGDGKVEAGETCDDKNTTLCDGCEACTRRGVLSLPFGLFDGTTRSGLAKGPAFLRTPGDAAEQWDGRGQGTIEFWMTLPEVTAAAAQHVLGPDAAPDKHFGKLWFTASKGRVQAHFLDNYTTTKPTELTLTCKVLGNESQWQPGVWVHVAAQWGDMGVQLYCNGRLYDQDDRDPANNKPPPTGPLMHSGGLLIGAPYKGGTAAQPAPLLLDDVRVSDTARYRDARFKPERHLAADANTTALYTFDDAPGATSTLDQVDNGKLVMVDGAKIIADDCKGAGASAAACGDGKLAPWELCDDGNDEPCDGCRMCAPEGVLGHVQGIYGDADTTTYPGIATQSVLTPSGHTLQAWARVQPPAGKEREVFSWHRDSLSSSGPSATFKPQFAPVIRVLVNAQQRLVAHVWYYGLLKHTFNRQLEAVELVAPANAKLIDGSWHHFAVTFAQTGTTKDGVYGTDKNAIVRFFIDGAEVQSAAIAAHEFGSRPNLESFSAKNDGAQSGVLRVGGYDHSDRKLLWSEAPSASVGYAVDGLRYSRFARFLAPFTPAHRALDRSWVLPAAVQLNNGGHLPDLDSPMSKAKGTLGPLQQADDCHGGLDKPAVCGDGKVTASEACDDGNTDTCDGCRGCQHFGALAALAKPGAASLVWRDAADGLATGITTAIDLWYAYKHAGKATTLLARVSEHATYNGRWSLDFAADGKLHVVLMPAQGKATAASKGIAAPVDGTWHHLAVVIDPATCKPGKFEVSLRIYLDGALAHTEAVATQACWYFAYNHTLWFGVADGTAQAGQGWSLDDVHIRYTKRPQQLMSGASADPHAFTPPAMSDQSGLTGRTFRHLADRRDRKDVGLTELAFDHPAASAWFTAEHTAANKEASWFHHRLRGVVSGGAVIVAQGCRGAKASALRCGDGEKAPWEDCDDGNRRWGDGCPGDCRLGDTCTNDQDCRVGRTCDASLAVCAAK